MDGSDLIPDPTRFDSVICLGNDSCRNILSWMNVLVKCSEKPSAIRLTTIKDVFGTVEYGYERDEKGRITAFTVHGVRRNFSYDGDDQIIRGEITQGVTNRSYSYDDNFNRSDLPNNAGIGKDNRLLRDGQFKYEYDKNGNLLKKIGATKTVSYAYDQRNRLVKVTSTAGGSTTNVSYIYDASDRMAVREIDADGDGVADLGKTETFIYDGPNPLMLLHYPQIGESGDPAVLRRWLYGLGEDEVLAEDSRSTRWWLLSDHQGSIRRVLGAKGGIARRIDYDEFGNTIGNKGNGVEPLQKYTGQFYDPSMGRFLNQDPAEEGTNWYAYVGNNSLNLTDPTGLSAFGDDPEFSSFRSAFGSATSSPWFYASRGLKVE